MAVLVAVITWKVKFPAASALILSVRLLLHIPTRDLL